MLFFLLIIPSIFILVRTVSIEESNSRTTFNTNKLPRIGPLLDFRLVLYIGNGHVATVVYSDFIYMNGLYNGENGTSHRARIPSTVNWKFKLRPRSSLYTLNVSSGKKRLFLHRFYLIIFVGIFIETLENHEVRIERRFFASQEYTELLIIHAVLIRKAPKGRKIIVPVKVHEQITSIDINFTVVIRNSQYVLLFGKTREIENNQFQKEALSLFVYYTPLTTKVLELDKEETNRTYLFVTSIDNNQTIAKQSFDYATIEQQADVILSSDISRWNDVYSNGHIDIEGDDELQRQINSAFYYILSSLPPLSTKSERKQFYGLSPGTLSQGGRSGEDYRGHSFWDTETWILAKEILSYRIGLRDSASYNARLFGYEGWRFPWESARTSVDVTPACCPEGRLYEIHITGDIAFAARQYISATYNQDWLLNEFGGELIYETVRFWGSRAVYNNETKQYEILKYLQNGIKLYKNKENAEVK
ncbi:unnamed protein product [Rotaria sp. Silwood2]|nr:unnamed protein product [Rotaria sp. Silwood2]